MASAYDASIILPELRNRKGFSQEILAEESGLSLRTIQRIENSENVPRGKTLNLICDVLEIDVEELMSEYFDIMLYMANWGSRRLMFRIPQELIEIIAGLE